ncbi:hypothetical protein DCC39_12710 [Pueribacillus theae]|uniref:Lipoprotein n=1 Tax=Pueribacillus theae TaxID=2171751 RepID=A0A2U1JWW0_9BACI|nr:PCYCGC motif-containing (lipo)protein [Pueribacillus theae]PWA09696.1 hypothetical protein DCC39_12710 [Pueribacillus theae]
MRKIAIVLLLLSVGLLGACSTNHDKERHDEEGSHVMEDLREETVSQSELPAFLNNKSDDMKMVYTAVAQHQDLLEQIPCYCGCGETVGHKDNYDCFIHENKEDGSVVWDDHATRCQACLDIAAESIVLFNEGKPVKDIRSIIDDKYKEGYAEPTPTPEV